jgi:dTMP kinase
VEAEHSGSLQLSAARAHGSPGTLIVIEGGDRSGRSTQVQMLVSWLEKRGHPVVQTDWSTSPHISKAIHKAKAEGALRPITFSLFYAADFADRVANVIVPALERGDAVVADRYVYTAYARDAARGANRDWVEILYRFAPQPDVVFYLKVPPHITAERIPSIPVKALDQYEFGLDLGLSSDPAHSFRLYQQRVFDQFEQICGEHDLIVLDGERNVDSIHRTIRDVVRDLVRQ